MTSDNTKQKRTLTMRTEKKPDYIEDNRKKMPRAGNNSANRAKAHLQWADRYSRYGDTQKAAAHFGRALEYDRRIASGHEFGAAEAAAAPRLILDDESIRKVMFDNKEEICAGTFRPPIGEWDVSGVTDMSELFEGWDKFNQPIGNWDTSNVTTMKDMFYYCASMDQPIYFDTRNVTNMQSMFSVCTALNKPVVFTSTSNVRCMSNMFSRCENFNQSVNFDMQNVRGMVVMFADCMTFNNGGRPLFMNTCSVYDMRSAFAGCISLSQVVTIDARSAVYMRDLFSDCINLSDPILFHVQEDVNDENMFVGTPHYAFTGIVNICVGA
jgi:surface protein